MTLTTRTEMCMRNAGAQRAPRTTRRCWRPGVTAPAAVLASRVLHADLVSPSHAGNHGFKAIPSYGARRSWEPSP